MTNNQFMPDLLLNMSNLLYLQHTSACRDFYAAQNGKTIERDDFDRERLHVSTTGTELIPKFQSIFQPTKKRLFDRVDHPGNYRYNCNLSDEDVVLQHWYFGYHIPDGEERQILRTFLERVTPEVERSLGYHFVVCNVRCWEGAGSRMVHGFDWHHDGFAEGVVKILVYLQPPNLQNGTTFVRYADREEHVEREVPAWALIQTTKLIHRGHMGETPGRRVIEFTLAPYRGDSDLTLPIMATNAMYPWIPPNGPDWANQDWSAEIKDIAPLFGYRS